LNLRITPGSATTLDATQEARSGTSETGDLVNCPGRISLNFLLVPMMTRAINSIGFHDITGTNLTTPDAALKPM
jgi:hypothetical protein